MTLVEFLWVIFLPEYATRVTLFVRIFVTKIIFCSEFCHQGHFLLGILAPRVNFYMIKLLHDLLREYSGQVLIKRSDILSINSENQHQYFKKSPAAQYRLVTTRQRGYFAAVGPRFFLRGKSDPGRKVKK